MGLFDFIKKKKSGNDADHFDYVFVVRRKQGNLPCDTEHGWERIVNICQNVAVFKKAKIVHPRDWDDEPYEDPLFNFNCGILKKYIEDPDSQGIINFSDIMACESSLAKRQDYKEELKFACYNLLSSGISKHIVSPNLDVKFRNAAFEASGKASNRKGMFVLRFQDSKLGVAEGKNIGHDVCEGIAFVHVTGRTPK